MTYELTQKQHAQEDEENKNKTIAFKSTNQEVDLESEENDKKIAFITRKFKQFMKRK